MDRRNRNLLLILIGALVLILCCCTAAAVVGGLLIARNQRIEVGPPMVLTVEAIPVPTGLSVGPNGTPATEVAPTPGTETAGTPEAAATPAATANPALEATPAVSGGPGIASGSPISSTTAWLDAAVIPARDQRLLAMRLKPNVGNIPEVVNATPPAYKVGDQAKFWVVNNETQEHNQVTATLRYVTPHVYMWVENGANVNDSDLKASADRFETKTYPTDRSYFGSEWTPGVDNDVHLSILHAHGLGSNVAGYFSASDEYSHLVNQYSNEREMFYMSLDDGNAPPNSSLYDGTLAHEFQHMIHWNTFRNEDSWVNEGMSEVAMQLNGFDTGGAEEIYARRPDTQLTTWAGANADQLETIAHYGGSYLFFDYLADRFGAGILKLEAAPKAGSIRGVEQSLAASGTKATFDQVFADWMVANMADQPNATPKGAFGYPDIDPPVPQVAKTESRFPVTTRADVAQYGADYITLRPPSGSSVTVKFAGQPQVGLVATQPHGKYAWYSNRADDSDTTLTRAFDLSGLKTATLTFSTWYDIEDGWDYTYVEASTDNGQHWTPLTGQHSTDTNPVGNAFGPGWTGVSGGGNQPAWINEKVDLTPFAGKKILLRFEYVTDDAYNGPSMMLDDIAIPELNFTDGGETGVNGWQASGWVLTDGTLPERWLVQAITITQSGVQVERMDVGANGNGQMTIPAPPNGARLLLNVSAEAPTTTERAGYSYTLSTP